MPLGAAPQGSGFETAAVTNDAAITYIRGMIAAAAADGRIDAKEQQKILGGLQQAGLGAKAEEYEGKEIREIFVKPYRLFYRVQLDQIDILAVIHAARELPTDVE